MDDRISLRHDFYVTNLRATYIELSECISIVYVGFLFCLTAMFQYLIYSDVFPCKSMLIITVKQEADYCLRSERHANAEDKKPMSS